MAKGLFRTSDGWAQAYHDSSTIPVARAKYEEHSYKPDFDSLPLEADFWAAQEEAGSNCRAPSGRWQGWQSPALPGRIHSRCHSGTRQSG
jgi:hypothetical protein